MLENKQLRLQLDKGKQGARQVKLLGLQLSNAKKALSTAEKRIEEISSRRWQAEQECAAAKTELAVAAGQTGAHKLSAATHQEESHALRQQLKNQRVDNAHRATNRSMLERGNAARQCIDLETDLAQLRAAHRKLHTDFRSVWREKERLRLQAGEHPMLSDDSVIRAGRSSNAGRSSGVAPAVSRAGSIRVERQPHPLAPAATTEQHGRADCSSDYKPSNRAAAGSRKYRAKASASPGVAPSSRAAGEKKRCEASAAHTKPTAKKHLGGGNGGGGSSGVSHEMLDGAMGGIPHRARQMVASALLDATAT